MSLHFSPSVLFSPTHAGIGVKSGNRLMVSKMSASSGYQVTDLLLAWGRGDRAALDKLVPLVHSELKRLARHHMRSERQGHTLQTTALVNEAFLRLIDARQVGWQNRGHFFGIASRVMRQILVDFARAQKYQKRGGGALRVSFDEQLRPARGPNENVLAVDEALNALAEVDQRKCRVVEMRFFGGLKEKEIAAALGVSEETVRRDWRLARSWLLKRLNDA